MSGELKLFLKYKEVNPGRLTPEEYAKLEEEIRHPRKGIISDECLDFRFWCRGIPSRQEQFAGWLGKNVLCDLVPRDRAGRDTASRVGVGEDMAPGVGAGRDTASRGSRLRILEVGSGRHGRLSVMLAERGYEMTCMDPKAEDLPGSGVEVRREAFHYAHVDLTGYDFVVAQEPCEATEHIVRACVAQRIPFAVALCGVPHELISGEMPGDVYEWYEYLENIDRDYTELWYVMLYQERCVAVLKAKCQA